jgi:hypothetical protein
MTYKKITIKHVLLKIISVKNDSQILKIQVIINFLLLMAQTIES